MKRLKTTILILVIVLASAVHIYAQTPPRTDHDYYQCNVYYNGSRTAEKAYTIKGNVYVDVNTLARYGDLSKYTIDTQALKLLFYPSKMDLYIGDPETSAFIKQYAGEMYLPLKNIYGDYYVSIGSVAQMAGLTYNYEDYKLYLGSLSASTRFGTANESGASAASSLISGTGENLFMEPGDIAYVIGETNSYYQIQTLSGDVEYVSRSSFTEAEAGEIHFDFISGKRKKKDYGNQKINLVWVEGGNRTELCPTDLGIDVLSPGWFTVENGADGCVKNYCDYGFVELAHVQGYEVWGCANDFGGGTKSSYIRDLLADDTTRNRQAAQYLMYAAIYNLDGINIDYETIIYYKVNFDSFGKFMRTLSNYCAKMGLKLSVDTNVPTGTNQQCFDFPTLGKVCDYVIPMTYEQYNGKTEACSVSDYDYYSYWVNELKKLVPAERIMMGVPFFGVSWVYKEDGSFDFKSALIMSTQRARITENAVTPQWDESLGQFYTEYYAVSDGMLRRMYIENSRSIAHRLQFVFDSGIAGSGCWRYGQQESGVLDVFYQMYKCGTPSYYFDSAY